MILSRESTPVKTDRAGFSFVLIRANSRLGVVLPVVLLLVLFAVGCRSHVIQVTLINTSTQPVSNIIVDYPGATFGKNTLAPGDAYHYVIKPLETGALKIQFTNAQGVNHSFSGPTLQKDQEGSIEIKLNQESASATPALM
jgi:hypothetical protein